MHTGCPSVRLKKQKRATTLTLARATKDSMLEKNDHLLAGAWWVTLKSPDLFFISSTRPVKPIIFPMSHSSTAAKFKVFFRVTR